MRVFATLGAAALAIATFLGPGSASAAPAESGEPAIPLNGEQEPPGGDADGAGFFTYDLAGTMFCWTLRWENIETAFAAHIHRAPRGVNGGIVIPLSVGDGSGAPVEGCATIDQALADAIAANPRDFYANVHNAPFPGGAIRGQLK